MFIRKVTISGSIDASELHEACSLWRRQVEARQTLGFVDIDGSLELTFNATKLSRTAQVETVIDIVQWGTLCLLNMTAPTSWFYKNTDDIPSELKGMQDWELYIPVALFGSNDINFIRTYEVTSAYVCSDDSTGSDVFKVLGDVMKNIKFPVT